MNGGIKIQKSVIKTCLAYWIIILFIGLIITPTISGIIGKLNCQPSEKYSTNFPLNDYVNGYWEFDNCSGDTAFDSSGHDYDGTIYGATWISYDSGCALDFDGEDDYISIDDYSENLGINKTDDVIFSVYFNSTSNEEGFIYCMSDSLSEENLELSIKLCANGSISFGIWIDQCGFSLCSGKSYNDGKWHFLTIVFDGTTAKPIVNIFVDNDLDGTKKEWLCPMSATEYKTAKIGSKAVSEEMYFNGSIDRLKIIKYPGGNEEPYAPDISGPTNAMPGEQLTYTFLSEDLELDEIWYQIDWDDGNITNWIGPKESGEEITRRHTYSEDGIYYIKARAKDFWDEGLWSEFTIIIGNLPPEAPTINGSTNGQGGIEYEYIFNVVDPNNNEVKFFIDWGDNNTEWTGYIPSSTDIKLKHSWEIKGTYKITAKAKDSFDAEGPETTLEVTMPKNHQVHNTLFLRFLENHPHMFPILRSLLGL